MIPHQDKGYHLFIDNYYNSVTLAYELLSFETHVTGTMRYNRKGNPVSISKAKLKKRWACLENERESVRFKVEGEA